MPTPRPVDPYRPPQKTERPGDQLPSGQKISGGKLALIFFTPALIFASSLGVVMMTKGDAFLTIGFLGALFAMIVVSCVFARHFAGNGDQQGVKLVGFFFLTAVAQIFVNSAVFFGGCIVLYSVFARG